MDFNYQIFTQSAEETKKIGRDFANRLKGHNGIVLALVGDLGSGKTTFVQGLAEGLGIKEKIISPTFILQRQYEIPKNKSQITNFYHIDLYRLEGNIEDEITKIGLKDTWGKPENITVIEWADKSRESIPASAIWITFEQIDETRRKISVNYPMGHTR
ncbi:MAG: UPF0079 ATP-binding protein [Microgenomates group bacterium Gr01-1014_5]|nr:MAG: UPF0079 ATP-binding protein [Microgenomates group bacterium Gr01-1014_5]